MARIPSLYYVPLLPPILYRLYNNIILYHKFVLYKMLRTSVYFPFGVTCRVCYIGVPIIIYTYWKTSSRHAPGGRFKTRRRCWWGARRGDPSSDATRGLRLSRNHARHGRGRALFVPRRFARRRLVRSLSLRKRL